jgi:hypothetical protein
MSAVACGLLNRPRPTPDDEAEWNVPVMSCLHSTLGALVVV